MNFRELLDDVNHLDEFSRGLGRCQSKVGIFNSFQTSLLENQEASHPLSKLMRDSRSYEVGVEWDQIV